jgi:hypothetical protein
VAHTLSQWRKLAKTHASRDILTSQDAVFAGHLHFCLDHIDTTFNANSYAQCLCVFWFRIVSMSENHLTAALRMHQLRRNRRPAMLQQLRRLALAAFCLGVVWLVTTPTVNADDWDKATRITVNQPFKIPGVMLPAGTYVVKIVDLAADRHVVRFYSEDETKVYATVLGIPSFRFEPTENSAFTFYESELNQPRALRDWFYPGYQYGTEFIYPKTEAVEIATVVQEPVPAFVGEIGPFWHDDVTPAELLQEPVEAVTPEGHEIELASVLPESNAPAEPEFDDSFAAPLPALPRTGTAFPLIGFIGLCAAGVGLTLRSMHH